MPQQPSEPRSENLLLRQVKREFSFLAWRQPACLQRGLLRLLLFLLLYLLLLLLPQMAFNQSLSLSNNAKILKIFNFYSTCTFTLVSETSSEMTFLPCELVGQPVFFQKGLLFLLLLLLLLLLHLASLFYFYFYQSVNEKLT